MLERNFPLSLTVPKTEFGLFEKRHFKYTSDHNRPENPRTIDTRNLKQQDVYVKANVLEDHP